MEHKAIQSARARKSHCTLPGFSSYCCVSPFHEITKLFTTKITNKQPRDLLQSATAVPATTSVVVFPIKITSKTKKNRILYECYMRERYRQTQKLFSLHEGKNHGQYRMDQILKKHKYSEFNVHDFDDTILHAFEKYSKFLHLAYLPSSPSDNDVSTP